MKVFYVRCSTAEQNPVRQTTAAQGTGAEKVFIDMLSGKDTNRPQLKAMLEFVREGDVVVVSELARLARSTKDLLSIVEQLQEKNVDFISLKENIDTSTPQGKFMLTVFAAMAELERETILQRQREGIEQAKAAGKYKGRKPITVDTEKWDKLYKRWKAGNITAVQFQKEIGLKPVTFYRRVKEYESDRTK